MRKNRRNPEQLYKVVKIGRQSRRRQILEVNLTLSEAQRVVARYPNSSRSMVVFYKQKGRSTRTVFRRNPGYPVRKGRAAKTIKFYNDSGRYMGYRKMHRRVIGEARSWVRSGNTIEIGGQRLSSPVMVEAAIYQNAAR